MAGTDGMTVEEALPYLREHQQELTDRIYRGKYTPSPVRRVEIPKPDGGMRKLGIPTVVDRTIQQAIARQLMPIHEPLFAETSYGYRPNKSAKDAILKVYARGRLNYYGIASMKNNIEDINSWLYHRMRMCIWKQWKRPRTKIRNLMKMGVPMDLAWKAGNSRRGYWFTTHTVAINMAMTKERRIGRGFYDLTTAYQSVVHVNY